MTRGPSFLPEEIARIEAPCPRCGATVRPDLWRECESDFSPVYPNGTSGEKGAWVRTSATSVCKCGQQLNFPIEFKKLQHPIFFYGDDADRPLGEFTLHSYSLIGATSGPIRDMVQRLADLKKQYVPTREPDSWRVHATEMRNGRKRITHPVYKSFTKESLERFFLECAQILKERESMTWNQHVTAIFRTPSHKKDRSRVGNEAKALAHNALLSYAIHSATAKNLRPVFSFDATKPVRRYPHIEAWSYDTYSGSRRYLAHAYLTHSNDVQAPSLVNPGSHPCLELADVHAYFAARSTFQRFSGEQPELSLTEFGRFCYLAIVGGERFEFEVGNDIPTRFHPIRG